MRHVHDVSRIRIVLYYTPARCSWNAHNACLGSIIPSFWHTNTCTHADTHTDTESNVFGEFDGDKLQRCAASFECRRGDVPIVCPAARPGIRDASQEFQACIGSASSSIDRLVVRSHPHLF